ncbi:hypothetical protein UFOVP328_223 [uncultured Caudovirales phage]|uniref:Uncharacterized protein n=1 Tax=uncultured Caudovirales phage TaxID=2100421 RepID=A0A6J5LZ44_9CAUD|nr:hypothetical protein UFOVP328_223 [uncultured Caudovirales phage]
MIQPGLAKIEGFVKIFDPVSGEVLVDKKNAIHYENISISMAQTLANRDLGWIYVMAFGNGGSSVDPTGVITYLPPNVTGQNADLYNQTYEKVVDDNSASNTDPANNNLTVLHTTGKVYTDILVSCLLDYGEPPGQQAFDNSTNFNGEFVFDELGLKTWNGSATDLRLITHVIFHPVQKSLNRQIQIDYTLRIQTLTNLSAA